MADLEYLKIHYPGWIITTDWNNIHFPNTLPIITLQDEEMIREAYQALIRQRIKNTIEHAKQYRESVTSQGKLKKYHVDYLKKQRKRYEEYLQRVGRENIEIDHLRMARGYISIWIEKLGVRNPKYVLRGETLPIVIAAPRQYSVYPLGRYVVSYLLNPLEQATKDGYMIVQSLGRVHHQHIHPHLDSTLLCRGRFTKHLHYAQRFLNLATLINLGIEYLARIEPHDTVVTLRRFEDVSCQPNCTRSHRAVLPMAIRCTSKDCIEEYPVRGVRRANWK